MPGARVLVVKEDAMTRRVLAVICSALLVSASLVAQSRGGASDPITGTWTGELVPQGGDGSIAVTLQLEFDGKGAVSGTVSGFRNPGEVKKGTFDRKNGSLILQLGRTDAPAVLVTLDGTVAGNAASGRMSGENGPGTFKLARKT
jgi:hypothetical protein